MGAIENQEAWEEYRAREMHEVTPLLEELGIVLDEAQVHIGGERYLMSGHVLHLSGGRERRGSSHKLVLTGHKDDERVVVKTSADPAGADEIRHERAARDLLHKLDFASRAFYSPREILFVERNPRVLSVTEYIEQDKHFIERPLEEQFFLALRALEAQEGAHATTHAHAASIQDVFGMTGAAEYLRAFESFRQRITVHDRDNHELADAFEKAGAFLREHRTIIERYCGFLTHHDFFPHNLRVRGRELYLLDYSAVYFGNKYESWARFLNYMLQFSPALEKSLTAYVRDNRGPQEYLCLRLMRVYKIGFLLQFYAGNLPKTSGNLHALVRMRIAFWTKALMAMTNDAVIPQEDVDRFIREQEVLRSHEERARQREVSSSS
ncbi:MAG TPA: hypothetical protein VGP13_02075 [Candidatus Paceibacterota bacterium]|jgi:hypothetical protein|nr:hypothetical protein [Candidatus Paceibacterota bacterium]